MIVDPATLEKYRVLMKEDTDDFIADILALFYTNARVLMTTLDNTLAENNVDEFVRAAHTFKSTSAIVGAKRLSGLLADLEAQGRTKNLADLMPLLSQIKEVYEETEIQLKKLYP